jgi:hypothetical protein
MACHVYKGQQLSDGSKRNVYIKGINAMTQDEIETRIRRIEQALGLPSPEDENEALYLQCVEQAVRGNQKPLETFLANGGKIPVGKNDNPRLCMTGVGGGKVGRRMKKVVGGNDHGNRRGSMLYGVAGGVVAPGNLERKKP